MPGPGLHNSPGTANAIRFGDKAGQEQLWLHAQKDQLTEVENDEDKWVGQDRRKTIDRDEFNTIHRDRTEIVDRNEKINVHGWRTEEVDLDETITIHQNRKERVDHNETISIGDNRTEDVGKNEKIDIGINQSLKVGSKPAYLHNESYVDNVRGDEPGAGKGVISRTHVKISHNIDKSAAVYVNGRQIVRTGDKMWMNWKKP